MNINRDYLIINDVKKSSITLNNGSMFFYITDKNTQNIFVNLVINVSDNELIQKYANIENAEDYSLTMNIVKPDNDCKIIEGRLCDKEKAIFEFNLEEDCVDKIGTYKCELLTKCNINGHEEITTSNSLTYTVNSSILNDLDGIVEAPEYPTVIQLFDRLSEFEQYEEDRRANELARQLAEQQRQTRIDTLIADTEADIDEYKAAKDQEINTAINAQNDRITAVENRLDNIGSTGGTGGSGGEVDLSEYVTKEIGNASQITFSDGQTFQAKLDAGTLKGDKGDKGDTGAQGPQGLQGEQGDQGPAGADGRDGLTTAIAVNGNTYTHVDGTITLPNYPTVPTNISAFTNDSNYASEAYVTSAIANAQLGGGSGDSSINTIIDEHTSRLEAIEAIDVAQNNRLDAIEVKNQEQDDRLLDIEKVNKRQDMDLKCLFAESKNNIIDVTGEGNSIYLQNSTTGYTLIDEIKGNTLVNCNKEPDKELILNGNINTSGDNNITITEGADGGLVDVALEGNTLVNVSKTKDSTALPLNEELTYLYANTQYTLQFVSDKATTANITLGGTPLLAQSIVVGLNKITITTPATLVDNKLIISGIANISEVVVTDTDREFGYFEGMKSVGEGGNLVITSSNSDNSLSNTQTLTHIPLRSVGETKDRYVLLNGNWYIERKCGIRAYQEGDKDNYKTDLINTVYPLEMPAYEEIDYSPLEVYSGTTHITTNSTIPTNIIAKNHGFSCLLKPSTTYTISSNLGLNTVTTPSTLTEDCLRFMDTDTSDVTTMKDVLVLEGDWTTKADLIPSNFSGIESAFEQELVTDESDANYGKYRVNVKVANEDKSKENNITFYINEPLRGVGDVKDRLVFKNGKLMIGRNCKEVILSSNAEWRGIRLHGNTMFMQCYSYRSLAKKYFNGNSRKDTILCDKYPSITSNDNYDYQISVCGIDINVEGILGLRVDNSNLSSVDAAGFKEYIRNNNIRVVFQLETPTYEEIPYNDTKLFIELFKNSTLFYNSNVPVTSKLYYSYSVPIVDTVAQTANVTDEQDRLIIDLATQVSVLEMMTM